MLLSPADAAELLKVPEKTILRWIRKEGLTSCRVNDDYRLNRVDLLEWATDHGIKVPPELFDNPEPPEELLPPLSEVLAAGGIHYKVAGESKEEVLKRIVALMQLPAGVDREFLIQVLLAREALGTTAIGDGIAIPHVRNPILLQVATPTVTLCFLEHPIDFKAIDNKPVHILFTLISPTVGMHLQLLSKLAYALRDHRFQTILQRQGPAEEILTALRNIESELKS